MADNVCMYESFSVKYALVRTAVSTCQVIIETHCTAHGVKSIYYKIFTYSISIRFINQIQMCFLKHQWIVLPSIITERFFHSIIENFMRMLLK